MKTVKLGNVTQKIGSGATPRGGKKVYREEGVSFIRSQNVLDLSIKDDGMVFIGDADAAALAGVTVHRGDVLVNLTGDSVARVATWNRSQDARVSQHVAIVRPDLNKINGRFLQYLLHSPKVKRHLLTLSSAGGSRPALTKGMLEGLEVDVPDLQTQSAISSVLGALDDKIAANQRVMSICKSLSASLVDTAVGTCTLGEISTIYKAPIGVAQMAGKTVTSYSLPSFDDGWAPRVDGGSIKSGKTLLKEPVVLVSKLNPRIPRIWGVDKLPKGDSVASTEFVALRPKDGVKISHLWSAVSSPGFTKDVLHRVTGTTGSHQRITPPAMMEVEVSDPRGLSEETKAILESLLRSANLRSEENQMLARTRDELLPLLMDGRVTVKDAARVVEEV